MKVRIMLVLVLAALIWPVTAGTATAHPRPPANNPCVAGIRAAFPAQWHRYFIAVSWRESRWQQTAVNRRATSAGRASGCLQLLPGYARRFMRRAGCYQLLNGYCNARIAREFFRVAGVRPWRV